MAVFSRYRKKVYRKKTTKKGVGTLGKLIKKVNKIGKLAKAGVQTIFTQSDVASGLVAPYSVLNLSQYSAFAPIFGSDPTDYQKVNKWLHKSQTIDMSLNASNEMANIELSMYIVTLKDEANKIYNKTTGALTLVAGQDYVMSGANFIQTILNPKVFNVKWKKHLLIGNNNTALINSSGVGPRMYKRFHKKFMVNSHIKNLYGNVFDLTCSQDPSKQRFLIIFNDNSALDLEHPVIVFNMVNELQVST